MTGEKPELKHEKGYVVIRDVEVKLSDGICARPAAVIVRWSGKYTNEIIIQDSLIIGHPGVSSRSIMDLMTLEVHKGSKLNLMVQDLPNTNPEDIAKELYVGLTTDDFYPYLDYRKKS